METTQCWDLLSPFQSFLIQSGVQPSYSPQACHVVLKLLKSHFGFCFLYGEEWASEWIRWNK